MQSLLDNVWVDRITGYYDMLCIWQPDVTLIYHALDAHLPQNNKHQQKHNYTK